MAGTMAFDAAAQDALLRFLHILSGIVWIGPLYFFNLTNLPVFKFAIQNGDPNVKGAPALIYRALFWFRWGAMATLVFGLWLFHAHAASMGMTDMEFLNSQEGRYIAGGMVLGIIMWFNVWFLIWPAQKVVLGNNVKIAKGATPEEKT